MQIKLDVNYTLTDNEVHTYEIPLTTGEDLLHYLYSNILIDLERKRSNQYVYSVHRNKYILRRAALRILIGTYTRTQPKNVNIQYNRYGKPLLPPSDHERYCQFNLSFSEQKTLIAFTLGRRVGVDIQHHTSNIEYESIAKTMFAAQEYLAISSLPINLRSIAFYNCWTQKEAYIKAIGTGLSTPLNQFVVNLQTNRAGILAHETQPNEPFNWSLRYIDIPGNYSACLAVEGHHWTLQHRQLNWDDILPLIPNSQTKTMHQFRR